MLARTPSIPRYRITLITTLLLYRNRRVQNSHGIAEKRWVLWSKSRPTTTDPYPSRQAEVSVIRVTPKGPEQRLSSCCRKREEKRRSNRPAVASSPHCRSPQEGPSRNAPLWPLWDKTWSTHISPQSPYQCGHPNPGDFLYNPPPLLIRVPHKTVINARKQDRFFRCGSGASVRGIAIACSRSEQKPVLKYVTTYSSRFPTVHFDYKREPLKFHKVSLKKCKTTLPWWDTIISGILLTYSFTSDKYLKSLTQEMQNYSSLMGHSNKRNTSDIFLYIWETSEKSQEMQNYSSLMGHNNTRNISEIFLYIWKTSETTTKQLRIQLHAISSTPWLSKKRGGLKFGHIQRNEILRANKKNQGWWCPT